jgi:hypothetical protein
MKSLRCRAVCAIASAAWLAVAPTAPAAGLHAGVARIDITPTQPVTLAGYASRTNLSEGVHDPLSARAVAFAQDGKRLVLVSADTIGFYNDTAAPLRRAVLDACGLEPSELSLCAIHTHSAPGLSLNVDKGHPNNVEYTRVLQGKLIKVVRRALDRLAPVQVGVGRGSSPVGVNRREVVRDSAGATRVVLGRNPAAVTDREVQVLKLTREDPPALMGVVFAYATHSTSLGPRNLIVSGDVHGLAEQFVEAQLGPAVVAPAFAGASGNIDPWYRVLPGFNTTNGWIPEPVLLGTMLVVQVLNGIKPRNSEGPVRTAMRTVQLPGKARGATTAGEAAPPGEFVVTVGCVGDVAFVGLGGEVFNEIGQAIKTGSPFPHTFVFTHCNGAAGYVPTRSSYPEGGYEITASPFAAGADERLLEEVKSMLTALRSSSP